jgi:hypothetical protein
MAGFRIFGWAASTVAWLDIVASAATTCLLYAIVRALSTRVTAALAAAMYAVLTMPAGLYGNGGFGGFVERSVCETFIVVCVGVSVWCAVRFRERESHAAALGIGFFAGAAIVLKPNAGLYLPVILSWLVLYRRESARSPLAWSIRPVALAAIGTLVWPALTIAWLWRLDLLREAEIAVIDFNRFYVGQGFTIGGYVVGFSQAVWLRMKTDALWLAGGVASLVALWELVTRRRLPPLAGLAVIWGGAAALVIIVNGARLFHTYFIQAFAPLAVLAAWHLSTAARGSLVRRTLGLVTCALMLFMLLQQHYLARVFSSARADFDMLRGNTDRTQYLDRFGGYGNSRGYSARANAELAAYVRAHTGSDDRIFLFGTDAADVYFATDRLTAERFLRVNYFVPASFPDPRFRIEAVADELAAARPRYLIFEHVNPSSAVGRAINGLPEQPAVIRLLDRYTRDTSIEDFTLYRRID